MAAKLESVERRPALGLILRALVAALGVYLLRGSGTGIAAFLIFAVLFWALYLRPPLHNRKFLVSALALFSLPVLLPPAGQLAEWLLIIVWAYALFLLLGVKNLVLLKREGSYEVVHLLIIFGLGILYLLSLLPLVPQIILFITLFFLFREFYFTRAPLYPQRLTLTAIALAFILTEIAWILSFLPVGFLAGAAFLAVITYLFHHTILRHFEGTLSRQIILRNITLFIILSLILAFLPA